jgi:hypothetical protein
MTNRAFSFVLAGAVALAILAGATPAMAQYGHGPGYGGGSTTGGTTGGTTIVATAPATAAETQWLRYMREEEKFARDVYQQLYKKWSLTVFQNIATAEQAHFDAVGVLLTRYSVADPASASAGVYSDAKLNTLYNDLMAKGMKSAQDALEVGVLIEKTDIGDLESALKATDKLDIKRVYTNLLNASFNHLEAFETVCEAAVPVR